MKSMSRPKSAAIILSFLMVFVSTELIAQTVNPDGSLGYQYPIRVPEGTNGLQPALSLVYNSNGGNGMLGMGFGLSGLSVISRDSSYGINFNDSDHFFPDGQKLIKTSDGLYHTERESFIKIKGFNPNGTDSYWIITQKNGTKMYYGFKATEHSYATDGRIDAMGKGGIALLWSLSKVQDVHGNYYIIEYDEDAVNGGYYPVKITYTKNTGISKYKTIEFGYETRTDHYILCVPTKMDIDKRLKWITVKIDGNILRKYRLDYANGITTGRSRLTTIQEYGSDGTSTLPATTLEWSNNTDGNYSYTSFPIADWIDDWITVRYFPGDFNGDGLTDIVVLNPAPIVQIGGNWNQIVTYFSNGDGTYSCVQFSTADWIDLGGVQYVIGDYNGDGRTDIVMYQPGGILLPILPGGIEDQIVTFFSNGDGTYSYVQHNTAGWIDENNVQFHPGDYNGDGRTDIVVQNPGGDWNQIITYFPNGNISDRLTEIKNSIGGSLEMTYTPAPRTAGAVEPNGKSYPDIANRSPRPLVTELVANDGMENSYHTKYDYKNGMVHMGYPYERKNLGFEWAKKTNTHSGTYAKTYFKQVIPYQGLTDKEEIRDQYDNLYKVTQQQYDSVNNPENSEIKFIHKTNEYTYNYDGSPAYDTYRVEYVNYDDRGNCTQVKNYGNIDNPTDDSRIETDFIFNSSTFINVPSAVRKYAYNLDDSLALCSEERYFYDNLAFGNVDKGLCTKKEVENGDNDRSVSMGYDVYGNIVWAKDAIATATPGSGYTSQTMYDVNYKAYPASLSNALNHTRTINYDNLMRPVETINADGVSSRIVYDDLGREVAKIKPGDSENEPTEKIFYFDQVFPTYIKTQIKESGSSYLESFQYIDGLGRAIQAKSENPGGWLTIDKFYDEDGRDYKQSIPYVTTVSTFTTPDPNQKFTQKEYDTIGRVIKIYNTDGTFSQTIYDKRIITKIDPKGLVKANEVSGNMIYDRSYEGIYPNQNTTPYATTTAKKCWNGTILLDNNANTIRTNLDMVGDKLAYQDPDMGTWTYQYDLNSNLLVQTDAMGQTVSFEYDILNRPIRESHNGTLAVEYYYDGLDGSGAPDGYNHGYCKGLLTRVAYQNVIENYTYDQRGRLIECSKAIGGISKTRTLNYDSMDRVASETYPNGEIVNYTYGNDGNVIKVSGIDTYADNISYTALGKVKELTYGNGIITSYNYYDNDIGDPSNNNRTHSYRLKGIHAQKQSGFVIGDTNYEYDADGNIVNKGFIDDYLYTYYENYVYDDFNRLKEAHSSELYGDKYYDFSVLNNINLKDGKTYEYNTIVDGRHLPHAVSALKNGDSETIYTFTYDKNGNMTGETGYSRVEIQAKRGSDAIDSPTMELWVNGQKQARWIVVNSDFDSYKWNGYWDGVSKIDVVYVDGDGPAGDIADLVIDCVKVNGVTVQSESSGIDYDKGFYPDGCFDGIDVESGKEILPERGSLRFTVTGASPLSRTITYDPKNRVSTITENGSVSVFDYDPSGHRIKKVENNVTTLYFFGNYEVQLSGSETTEVLYYFANGQRIAQRLIKGSSQTLLYIHTDHLGSAVRVTDASGGLVQTLVYDPYGRTVYRSGMYEPEQQFTGQRKDGSGLYYYVARYYDPEIGIFISADTVLDGLNRYTYCRNNPVIYTDPTGRFVWYVPLIAAAIGGVIGGINAYLNGQNVLVGALAGMAIGAISGAAGSFIGDFVIGVIRHSK